MYCGEIFIMLIIQFYTNKKNEIRTIQTSCCEGEEERSIVYI